MQSIMEDIRKWLNTKHVGQAFQPAMSWPELKSFAKEDFQAVKLYRRRLPHWELEGSSYFVTFRVHPALWKPLSSSALAGLIEEVLWHGYGERYSMDGYVIMPDHVHLLIKPLSGWTLAKILQGIKGFTAREINKMLCRTGPFWQRESFDHLIRNESDWLDKLDYIHNNPVTGGLVETQQDYPYSSLVTMHSKGRLESLPHKLRPSEDLSL